MNQTTQIFTFPERRTGHPPLLHHMNISDAALLAPMSLFYPEVLEPIERTRPSAYYTHYSPYSDDVLTADVSSIKSYMKPKDEPADQYLSMSLHQAIIASLSQIAHKKETRKKIGSNILLVGGSSRFPGLRTALQERLIQSIPPEWDIVGPSQSTSSATSSTPTKAFEVLDATQGVVVPRRGTRPLATATSSADDSSKEQQNNSSSSSAQKELNPSEASWRGGAIIAGLPGATEMFMTRQQFNPDPELALRTRAPFTF
eukprot:TRINITY_DN8303_c1_g1_i1.p1 TRINITY_DN8303_c1_g1~~TRINITY_DN8303_c1_g1_i1.p1  ORF type:complete len:269 (+),score=49.52 TRINITY_DN8303_c1_g1_i1:34-807(+)